MRQEQMQQLRAFPALRTLIKLSGVKLPEKPSELQSALSEILRNVLYILMRFAVFCHNILVQLAAKIKAIKMLHYL
jgi:hypothetical protein